jgi:hypothetical protein
LRHHTLYPINEPGFATPNPQTYYIHHPMLTHQLVTFTFLVFGEHEWSVRLAALIPSTLSLLLVAAIAWRNRGPLAGGAAALVFAFVPVNIWYGSHIDQGFPSIACLLAFFWFYLRWLQGARWPSALAALAFEALAGCFEWSPYFAFPVIFAHALWTGWRRGGRFRTFVLVHPLVAVVLPLGVHFWAVWRVGLLDDLLAAYRNRTAEISYRAFIDRMEEYAITLYGRVLMVAMVLWLCLALGRLISRRGRAADLVGLTFAFALISYMHVFKTAVVTHAYRQLYGNVWAALSVGDLVMQGGTLLRRKWPLRAGTSEGLGMAASLAVLALVTATTLPTSWAGLMESRLHGGVPGWKVFDPDLRQTAFASAIEGMTTQQDVLYYYPSFTWTPPHRMDWAFYYDRDPRRGRNLRSLTMLSPGERQHAVAIFFESELWGDERKAFAELAARHPVFQVGDLAALDLRIEGARISAYRLAPPSTVGRGILRQWLDGPYPFPRLLPDPALQNRVAAQVNEGR